MMQMYIRGFVFVAVLCCVPAAFGSIVIDSFASPVLIGPNPKLTGDNSAWITRTGSTGTVAAAITNATYPTFVFASPKPDSSYVELQYTLPALTSPQTISFTYSATAGTGGGTVPDKFNISLNNVVTTISVVKGATFTDTYVGIVNASISNPVTSLILRVTYNTDPVGVTSPNSSFAFTSVMNATAVPEPATLTLLGLTGIAGVIAHRRRRKSQLTA